MKGFTAAIGVIRSKKIDVKQVETVIDGKTKTAMVKLFDSWQPFEIGWIPSDALRKIMHCNPLSKQLSEVPSKPTEPALVENPTSEQTATYKTDKEKYKTDLEVWEEACKLREQQIDEFNNSLEVVFYKDITRRNLEAVLEPVQAVVFDLETNSESSLQIAS